MDNKKSRTIKNLEIKANKGNVIAKFQLFQYLKNGQFTDKNPSLAADYLSQIIEDSSSFNFRFDEVELFNFRRFESLTLKTSPSNLTVIIGNNGSGKTSILDAIAKSLSWFVNNVIREDTTGQKLVPKDINGLDSVSFVTVKSKISFFDKNTCSVELTKPKASNDEGLQGDYATIKLLADMYRYLNSNTEKFNLPMLAYYPVERTQNHIQIQPSKIEKFSNQALHSIDGYDYSLSSNQNFNRFLGWYKRLSVIDVFTSTNDKKLINDIATKEKMIAMLQVELSKKNLPSSTIKTVIQVTINELNELKQLAADIKIESQPSSKLLEFINAAIIKFMPEVSNIRYEVSPEDGFFLDKSGIKLEAKQLSQGERTLIALIGDIARRMVFLNPSLSNPLSGSGVILIDEIELHIHPIWQQNILINLTTTFPNIQFIVTTHSPQVLSTVDVNSIRKLDSENNTITTPKYQTKGVTSADILSQIMETNSVPDIKEARDLNKLIELIQQDLYDSREAKSLLTNLEVHFGKQHPEIIYCEDQVRLQKMKAKARDRLTKK